MKRVYLQPEVQVLNIQLESMLLSGSTPMGIHTDTEADEVW